VNALDQLAGLLRRKPLTAKDIARITRCCKPTAYARVEALKERGEPIVETRRRAAGKPGPYAITYEIRG
jgi:hypothetical protein